MAATASFNNATKIITVASDGLPRPVSFGTFPNENNPNTVTEQDFDHDFLYRGGTFGVSRVFDNTQYTHDGFIRSITLSVNDIALFTGVNASIKPNDRILFVFNDYKLVFVFRGTTFTSIAGECWLAADDRLDLIVGDQASTPVTGTYEYYDQRNGRSPTPLGTIGVAANGVALFNPSAGAGGNPPPGFSWNAHFPNSPVSFGPDTCGGHPEQSGQYHYHDTHFLDCWRDGSAIASYNDYYGSTQFNGDNIRHPDGHSKMVGISFDGFPIYGPFAYTDAWDSLSGTSTMSSSYAIRDTEAAGRPDYGSTTENPPAGALIVDWEYVEGTGTLDYHNGRFCVTPEYPDGTYAYFLSVDDQNDAKFPYMVGLTTRETIDTTFTLTTVQPDPGGGDPGGGGEPPAAATLQFTLQPQNVTVNVGETATFTVTAQIIPTDGPISYQWYRSTDGGFAFAAITGATSATYEVTGLAYMTGYKFRCEISGPVGATPAQNSPLQTEIATLTVTGFSGGSADSFDSTESTLDSTTVSFDAT